MKKFILLILLTGGLFTRQVQGQCDFKGEWKTIWNGNIKAYVSFYSSDDKNYSGSYYYYNKSTRFEGTLDATIVEVETFDNKGTKDIAVTLEGTWREGNLSGIFSFQQICSMREFAGQWKNNAGTDGGEWYGTR